MELTERLKAKVAGYKVSPAALAPIRTAPLMFTVGITAAGKNAVLRFLLQQYPGRYHFSVSHTTRAMRDYETPDVQYHFVGFEEMERLIDQEAFIEVNIVHADDVYGTSIAEIAKAQAAHKIACSDITIEGVEDYMKLGLNVRAAFLLPPSYKVWKRRLMARYEEAGEFDRRDMFNRLNSALREIRLALDTDYYYVIINDDLEEAATLVDRIAHGEPVVTHGPQAIEVAEGILAAIRTELQENFADFRK